MPSSLRPRRWTRWALTAALATGLGAGAAIAVPPAHAGQLASKRAEARRVEAQLNLLQARVDAAVQAYDQAASQLHQVRAAIVRNTAQLRIAQANLRIARAQLAQLVVAGYKGGGPDVTLYVLSASSFTELIDRIDLVDRADTSQSQLLALIATSEHQIAVHQRALVVEAHAAKRLVGQAAARRHAVQALVAHQRTVLASVKSDIATLIKQAQERRDRAAAAAAARAAAAAAQQQQQQQQNSGGGTASGGGTSGGGIPDPIPNPPPAGSLGQKAVQIAMGELGVPYVWGGASPAGFDCSGLTMWVYAQLGVSLDHYTGSQWTAGPHVSRPDLQPGDLVFFEPTIGHVGIYIGNGLFIHAPHTGDVVRISSLSDSWYAAEYQGAVRVTG